MPLTSFQETLAKVLAGNRSEQSHLAGGAALHFKPQSIRYSQDLDYFHDSAEIVASTFAKDQKTLQQHGYELEAIVTLAGFVRAIIKKDNESTKVEWSHDSAWRFMPVQAHETLGYVLHPVDLMINKLLALAGRDEARDLVDVIDSHRRRLSLGAMLWAAPGKDPGFTAFNLYELLRRRGKIYPDDLRHLHLAKPLSLEALKQDWLTALTEAEKFIYSRPIEEMGCLYYSHAEQDFVTPNASQTLGDDIVVHFGRPGGILPRFVD